MENDGEKVDVSNTKYTYNQEFFCSNLTKVDFLVALYDPKDIIMIRELNNTENVDPQVKWGPSKYCLLKDFAMFPLAIFLECQLDTNMYC